MTQERIYAVTLPKWGLEMTEGTVAAWHVGEGATVASGEDLVDIETDKIVNTLESEAGGLLRHAAP
ncbi:MAG: acetoin dehydrogenase dihydrolipoyllysine-residue acetyltransferase subunit, partial [Rhodospirillaceae bacterium]|nr:acetoin dehydrogenase dihydrolipoyllysine-residue acetyltransferase subunit [Rhodospirillaceae bacterium]